MHADIHRQGHGCACETATVDPVPCHAARWRYAYCQERTKAGRAAAQARGVKMGRKPLLSAPQVAHARTLLAQGERPVRVAHLLKVSRRTLERAVRRGGA